MRTVLDVLRLQIGLMQTNLADFIKDTPQGREADAILRKCVHCGFCTATCPTYQLLGDELDGPRGRIYLMKQVLEGAPATAKTQLASRPLPDLPRLRDDLPVGRANTGGCSTSAAPSSKSRCRPRRAVGTVMRKALRAVIPHRMRCSPRCLRSARRCVRCCLPTAQAQGAAERRRRRLAGDVHTRAGCWCSRAACSPRCRRTPTPRRRACSTGSASRWCARRQPAAAARCRSTSTRRTRRSTTCARNIDAWWPHIERGAEAIVMTASGCGDHGHRLRPPARARSRVCGQSGARFCADERRQRSHRRRER